MELCAPWLNELSEEINPMAMQSDTESDTGGERRRPATKSRRSSRAV